MAFTVRLLKASMDIANLQKLAHLLHLMVKRQKKLLHQGEPNEMTEIRRDLQAQLANISPVQFLQETYLSQTWPF